MTETTDKTEPGEDIYHERTEGDVTPDLPVLSAGGRPRGPQSEGAQVQVAEAHGGHAGLGGGGGRLELGWPGPGGLGRAAPGPQVGPAHDDDDGR